MDKVIKKLKELTRHSSVKILNSGNAAIFAAAYIISRACEKKLVLVPDQGGWMSFSTYPLIFGLNVKEIKTDKGVIDLKDLEENAKEAGALFVTSFAGYYAEQPMKRTTACWLRMHPAQWETRPSATENILTSSLLHSENGRQLTSVQEGSSRQTRRIILRIQGRYSLS